MVETAESLKGESTSAPGAGLLTVTLAKTGKAVVMINEQMNESFAVVLMKFLGGIGRLVEGMKFT
jgi:hypothetical protein